MNKNFKTNSKGITLIALVITIIVLLILAGVSIAAITSDDGIIKQAQNAKDETEKANMEERIDQVIIEVEGTHRNPSLDDIIDELLEKDIIGSRDDVNKETGSITTKNPTYVIDGKLDEWSDSENIIDSDEYKLYSKYDEGYLYLAVQLKSKTDGKIYVPISILGVGSQKDNTRNIAFDKNTDFVLEIDENGETRLLADSYYSTFHYIYGYSKGVFDFDNDYSVKNSGEYVRIQMFTSNEMYLPDDNKTIEPQFYESGLLKSGITDPDSDKFDNTADYYIADNTMEFRIPWYLLNVMNSTQGTVINDFYNEGSINFTDVQEINIGIGKTGDNIELKSIPFEEKQQSSYHTRLKKSYEILKEYLKKVK